MFWTQFSIHQLIEVPLIIPLGEVDPNGWCKLEAKVVKLCVYKKGGSYFLPSCNNWLMRNHRFLPDYKPTEQHHKLNNILDIECTLQKGNQPLSWKCFLGNIDKKTGIERMLKREYSEYKVNIKLITVKDKN